jgi:hypothetical protein
MSFTPRFCNSRHGPIRLLIQELHLRKFRVTCPWDGSEGKALERPLSANPSWTEEEIARMVRNRFTSEAVASDRPRKWLSTSEAMRQGRRIDSTSSRNSKRVEMGNRILDKSLSVSGQFSEPAERSEALVAKLARFYSVTGSSPDEPGALALMAEILTQSASDEEHLHDARGSAAILSGCRHSRSSTTMDIYAQFVPEGQKQAIRQLRAFVERSVPNVPLLFH